MAKRTRLTDLEAHAVKTRKSEPVGSRGKGTLLLERKASGAIMAFYRERTQTSDQRLSLGALAKKPRLGTSERSLDQLRSDALRAAEDVSAAGGIAGYLDQIEKQKAADIEESARLQRRAEISARRGTFGDLLDSYVAGMKTAGRVSTAEIANMFTLHVKGPHPGLVARAAADIEPEDIQLILAGVLGRKPQNRGKGKKAVGTASNGMRTTCDKLRRYLRAAFSFTAKSHLAPERLANDGKIFSIRYNPAGDIPVVQGTGGGRY